MDTAALQERNVLHLFKGTVSTTVQSVCINNKHKIGTTTHQYLTAVTQHRSECKTFLGQC